MAGISRRLVTTDSYDLPVARRRQNNAYGADGKPGGRGSMMTATESSTIRPN